MNLKDLLRSFWRQGSSVVLISILSCCGLSSVFADENELPALEVKAEEAEVEESTESQAETVSNRVSVASKSVDDPQSKELKKLRMERDLIDTRNALQASKLKSELAELKAEKERLALKSSLVLERMNSELAEIKAETEKSEAETDRVNKEYLLKTAIARNDLQDEFEELNLLEKRLEKENSIAQKEMEKELQLLRLEETKLKLERARLEGEVAVLHAQLTVREKEDILADQVSVEKDEQYLHNPFSDGVLRVSDRRISVNGVIWGGMSDYVIERINYYNNQSTEFPIFLVIDASPGGSVMAGYQILKAMEGSEAPVYVVVKSYAASMAAVITTLAEKSFAYPNAVILHHQLSWYGVVGNLTQQKEYAEEADEWWRRLAKPVAKKMGIPLDKFIGKMYEKNSSGDWSEFADKAVEYGWVDQVVDRIWETSVDKNPDRYKAKIYASADVKEMLDEDGKPFVMLPRLGAFDYYFLYDKSGYYRIP